MPLSIILQLKKYIHLFCKKIMQKVAILLFSLALCACSEGRHDHEHEHAAGHRHGHHAETESHAEHAAKDGEHHHEPGEIVVEPEVAHRFGIEIDTLASGPFSNTVRVAATVLPSSETDAVVAAPAPGMVAYSRGIEPGKQVGKGTVIAVLDARGTTGGSPDAAALANLNAARKEYERIKALFNEQLATVAELNAAEAAFNAADALYSPSAASGRAKSPINGTITALLAKQGQFVQAGDIVATVGSDARLTLRCDLPVRYASQAALFNDACVELPYSSNAVNIKDAGGVRITGRALSSDGAAAFVPVFFSVPGGRGFIPGSTMTAYLIGSARSDVATLPVEALSEQQGEFFVYEKTGDHTYAKRRVTVGSSDGKRVEIVDGIDLGTPVVVSGTTTVRLAESGANIPEGHTHNH